MLDELPDLPRYCPLSGNEVIGLLLWVFLNMALRYQRCHLTAKIWTKHEAYIEPSTIGLISMSEPMVLNIIIRNWTWCVYSYNIIIYHNSDRNWCIDIYKFNEKILYSIMLLKWWTALTLKKKLFTWKEKIAATINHNAKELDRQQQNMTHKSSHDDIQEAR